MNVFVIFLGEKGRGRVKPIMFDLNRRFLYGSIIIIYYQQFVSLSWSTLLQSCCRTPFLKCSWQAPPIVFTLGTWKPTRNSTNGSILPFLISPKTISGGGLASKTLRKAINWAKRRPKWSRTTRDRVLLGFCQFKIYFSPKHYTRIIDVQNRSSLPLPSPSDFISMIHLLFISNNLCVVPNFFCTFGW